MTVGLSHLNEHKFRNNFAVTLNPLHSCSLETVRAAQFLLRCRRYINTRMTLMNELSDIDNSVTSRQANEFLWKIHYGDFKFKDNVNKWIFDCNYPAHQNSNRLNQSLI